ncbi:hypothetical protein ACWS7L_08125 [Exiguobacterium artemiae]
MKDKLKELENKKEDIIHHLAWNCEWGSFEYECYKEDLEEVKNEILKITKGEAE